MTTRECSSAVWSGAGYRGLTVGCTTWTGVVVVGVVDWWTAGGVTVAGLECLLMRKYPAPRSVTKSTPMRTPMRAFGLMVVEDITILIGRDPYGL
jgi:hypothetical protein